MGVPQFVGLQDVAFVQEGKGRSHIVGMRWLAPKLRCSVMVAGPLDLGSSYAVTPGCAPIRW